MGQASTAGADVRVHGVSKRFGATTALDQVSMQAYRGEVLGLLGPNGAGKTTLIRCLLDIIKPDSGRIELFGQPFDPANRNRIGYLPEERGLYPRHPVGAVLEYLGALKGMSAAAARQETVRWLTRLELADAIDKKVEQLSKGNQQKVQLAATLLARPDVVILDEPLSGLDPLGARFITSIIRECALEGRTVILSTHQMSTVETLCTRVCMIAHGRVVLDGELRAIKQQYSSHAVRVLSDADYSRCPLIEQVSAGDPGRPADITLKPGLSEGDLLAWLVEARADVESFERTATPLEDIFVRVARDSAGELALRGVAPQADGNPAATA